MRSRGVRKHAYLCLLACAAVGALSSWGAGHKPAGAKAETQPELANVQPTGSPEGPKHGGPVAVAGRALVGEGGR